MIPLTRMKGDVGMRYIGSKTLLLNSIENILNKHLDGTENTFLDLFAGTNVVGNYFKKDYTIYSNDFLYFCYVNAKATIENNNKLDFNKLKAIGIENPFDYLQNIILLDKYRGDSYYETSYTPAGGTQYFSVDNGKRIDFIRNTIEEWKSNEWLTENEYFYLLSSLIEAIPFVSNTTGTYGAYLKKWDKRALKPLELKPIKVLDNKRFNKTFNEDANELIKKIDVDIAYVDPPYNSRQYASNYHVLENIARNNKPTLKGKTKIFDWSEKKSDYSSKVRALEAMKDLITNINATHIVMSYNTEGIIPNDDLIELMKEVSIDGIVDVERINYPKYNSKKPSSIKDLHEILIYIKKREPKKPAKIVEDISVTNWEANTKKYIKSPLNYVGGKYKLLNQIIPLFPNDIDTFVDLFSGGANVGINVEANFHIFNDMNNRINEMFRFFSNEDPVSLIKKIKEQINKYELSKYNKDGYLNFRKKYNINPNPLDLYILISYSYNYQIRFNNSMEFNNPFGKERSHFSQNMERNLMLFIKRLSKLNHQFTDFLFTDLDLSFLDSNDFVYLDPPYLITTGSYNDGNRGFTNWGEEQELNMYKLLNELTSKNIRYALSNVIEHKERENILLKDFISKTNNNVYNLDYHYNNSSHNSKKKGSKEVLITNYSPIDYKVISNSIVISNEFK